MKRDISLRMTVLLGAILFLMGGGGMFAATPCEETWVTDGCVRAIARTTDTVYIGGVFTYVGPNTGYGVPIESGTGQVAATFPKVNGPVTACVPDGLGGWYIGGGFTRVGGVGRNSIAHIRGDCSLDPAWNPNANGGVLALAVHGSIVYVGGGFSSIGGQTRKELAALDAVTGNATAWDPSVSWGGPVYALAVSADGSKVYAGGSFHIIGGRGHDWIAEIDSSSGVPSTWDPGLPSFVRALAISGTTLYVGGNFYVGLIAYDTTTGNRTAWNPNTNGTNYLVLSLAVSNDGSTVYVGGWFSTIGGQARTCLAAIDAVTGLATEWNPRSSADKPVYALALSGSTVYAGGDFTSIGGQPRNRIAALDAVTGNAIDWNPNPNNGVSAIAVAGSKVYAGGGFISVNGRARNRIAALDASTGVATAWDPNADERVLALVVSDDGKTVYAAGQFTSIGGQTCNRIAALDAQTGTATAWDPNANSSVYALALSGSTLYAGGDFTSIGGQPRHSIASLDLNMSSATTWNPNADGEVYALAVSGSTVYAGGHFWNIGGQQRSAIAALDAAGNATDWNPSAGGTAGSTVYALTVSNSTVYVGGNFMDIGGEHRSYIAALNAVTGSANAWSPNANSNVYALAISGSMLFAGGQFLTVSGQPQSRLAALSYAREESRISPWDPDPNDTVWALAVSCDGRTVYAGGDFIFLKGERLLPYFAQFDGFSTIPITRAAYWFLYK